MKRQDRRKMIQEKAAVLWNDAIGPGYYRLGLRCSRVYLEAMPGQFVMLQVGDGNGPLLRRPFSIHRRIVDVPGGCIVEILYKVVGSGTAKLAGYTKEHFIDSLGPLGNGFSLPDSTRDIVIVAGGIGVAPMLFLAEAIQHKGGDLHGQAIYIGGRNAMDLLCLDRFSAMGMRVTATTEDGSYGKKGFVVEPFAKALQNSRVKRVYACGPRGMLAAVASLSIQCGVPCQISVETTMACGMGACLGCALVPDEKTGQYHHACLDGPVFEAEKLIPFLSGF